VFVPEDLDHLRVLRGIRLEPPGFCVSPDDIPAPRLNLLNLAVFYCRDELGVIFVYNVLPRLVKEVEEKDHDNDDDGPKEKVFIERIQTIGLLDLMMKAVKK
jgi:hypothetical protein